MNIKIKLSTAISTLLLLTALTISFFIWPARLIEDNVKIQTIGYESEDVLIVTEDNPVMQEFIPSQNQVNALQVMVKRLDPEPGLFYFKLYDKELNLLFESVERLRNENEQNFLFYRFPINMEMKIGESYFYTLEYRDAAFGVCYVSQEQRTDNGKFYYSLEEMSDTTAVTIYEYGIGFSNAKIFQIISIIMGIAFAVCVSVVLFSRKNYLGKKISLFDVFRMYLAILGAGLVIFALYQTGYSKVFSTEPADVFVFCSGIVTVAGLIFYGIWWMTYKKLRHIFIKMMENRFVYIQSIFFALAILACIDFVNAGSNYAQGLATREMCIWFGAAMAVPFVRGIARNKMLLFINIGYIIVGIGLGYLYLTPFVGQGESFETAVRTSVMLVIWIYLMVQLIVNGILQKVKMSWTYTGIVFAFFVCLLLFRHSNYWQLATVIPFGAFYIWYALQKKFETVLQSIANGVVLSFIVVTIDSLLHRPFHYYIYIRYSGVFTTVTVTSVYLALVFVVVTVRLFYAYEKNNKHFSGYWIEIILFGTVSAYQLLTLSRTGIMTCLGVYFVACMIYIFLNRTIQIKSLMKLFAITMITLVLSFPTIFAACRIIPAMVNRPHIYDIEVFIDTIKKGEPIDSARYITLERFLGLSSERILGQKTEQEIREQEALTLSANKLNNSVEKDLIKEQDSKEQDSKVVVSTNQTMDEDEYGTESNTIVNKYSNGRIGIFKQYLSHLNVEGHPVVGLTLEDGTTIIHAHNSFLQMAYDCGILTGFIFIVLYIMLGFRSIKYYLITYKKDKNAMMPVLVFAAFGIASIVEYVFRPTIPLGFVFLAMLAPLLTDFERRS